MENGHGIEFEVSKKEEATEQGFSEKRAARIIEGKKMDNSQVAKTLPAGRQGKPAFFSPKQKVLKRAARSEVSKREKILAAHEKNAHVIIELIKTLGLITKGSARQQEQLMLEIRARQKLQEDLFNILVLEQQGNLVEDTLSKELQDLIK